MLGRIDTFVIGKTECKLVCLVGELFRGIEIADQHQADAFTCHMSEIDK